MKIKDDKFTTVFGIACLVYICALFAMFIGSELGVEWCREIGVGAAFVGLLVCLVCTIVDDIRKE